MASASFPVSLIIQAIDKATEPLRRVNAEVVKGAKQAAAATRKTTEEVGRLAKTAKAARNIGLAASVGVTAPLTALGALSVNAAAEFEEGLAKVGTLIDTQVEDLAEMGKRLQEMSRVMPVPLQELIDGLTEVRGAGISAADQWSVLEGSAKLAIVGLGQTAEAVDIVTSAMNAFGLHGEKSARIYNAIFQATNVGKATISQLAQGFGSVAGTVASAGVELEEYMAAVAALTTTGLPAAEAHRQLRAVIAGLMRQSKLTSAVLRHLGAKDLKELIKESGGLVPALNRVRTALRGNDAALLEVLGSVNALNATLGLTGAQADAFAEALQLMIDGGDTFEKKYQEKVQTFRAQTQQLSNAVRLMRIEIGNALVPAIRAITPLIERITQWFRELSPATKVAIVAMGAVVAAVAPALIAFSALVTSLGTVSKAFLWAADWTKYLWMMRASIMAGLIPSLKAAIATTWAFTASLLANPIVWLAAAIAAAGFLIYRNWNQITMFFRFLWEDITDAFSAAWNWLKKGLAWHPLALIVKHWEPIKTFFTELWEGVVGVFRWAWDQIREGLGKVGRAIKESAVFRVLGAATRAVGSFFRTGLAGDQANLAAARPALGAERAAPPAIGGAEAKVHVTFDHAPKGTRATIDPRSTADLDLDMGYSMIGP